MGAKREFFHESNFLTETVNLFEWSEALNSRFEVAYVVSVTRFRALRAPGAREAGYFFMDQFLLPRRFQRGIARPWAGSGSSFGSAGRQAGRQGGRQGSRQGGRTLRGYIYRYKNVQY